MAPLPRCEQASWRGEADLVVVLRSEQACKTDQLPAGNPIVICLFTLRLLQAVPSGLHGCWTAACYAPPQAGAAV